MPIFRRTNYIITASGIVTFCKRPYSMPDESRLVCFKFDPEQKSLKFLLEIMSLVSSAYNIDSDSEFIYSHRKVSYNWKKIAQNRDSWKKAVEQARTLYRL